MHVDNPFGEEIDFIEYEKENNEWMMRISTLLNSHTIKLLNSEDLYVIHMKEANDDFVYAHLFKLVK